MIRVGIHGASGKMGKEIASCLCENQFAKLSVAYSINEISHPLPKDVIITNDLEELFENSDVVIDFSIKQGAINLINYARTNPKPLVIGTTGLGEDGVELIEHAANAMPILYATNMSLGIALLNRLVALSSKTLRDFDIEIVEMHHKHKKDAPSGTALTLAEHAAVARNLDLKDVMVTGREGLIGARTKDEISVMALRGGDVVGRHTVGFYNDGEYMELNHTATSRATFAKGAIKAAVWLHSQPNGKYSIYDCIGL
ncbi:4-hydroxy-tetrahydrodipicolinate reductase [Campylobacter pinnipediorum]|uniref:4-hydroxy-tetrahydrodipicolinate reductase n=1 Tax=Campylobacter pinnipediorum subsp. pinnipediorum TaxID=1660067 RepID=A0AAX0LCJ0_9BACT|nr:4-hydroxy-tetrahydrodipicolinate reductase [Campylobacter pinnipediorum]AQW82049.1 4-hydroxy-tetrahydrodipicolinate reductase [Campylobacter pinnipediorum subsp. pinnipediorum]AQW83727.1 4-hydroxy-tetrahydrodipicolinate reductase [Campylobacter pinnipediorum subsp. pinnipediorum]AQW85246.1 4-hydroxy-tetrahydrodipicolinate reductase [Campylobacter pinnipediorum subsp. pinnipediorum]OPA80777.1 4-hydroxy-tetrahydrodipicolinate reductase [Campylobacter pinnipediorum subsp. pinnipediorum]OPA8212